MSFNVLIIKWLSMAGEAGWCTVGSTGAAVAPAAAQNLCSGLEPPARILWQRYCGRERETESMQLTGEALIQATVWGQRLHSFLRGTSQCRRPSTPCWFIYGC